MKTFLLMDSLTSNPKTHFDSTEWLESRIRFGMKAGLENIRLALETLGNPQKDLKVVLIGGTNGKGYTTSLLASLLTNAEMKVGWFCSPHLVSVRERLRIGETPISQIDLDQICSQIANQCGKIELTYFEAITLIGILYFSRAKVDWCLFEVGLGGRLDSTNVLDPDLSIITSIGKDHAEFLGDTLESILIEKCGIMRANKKIYAQITQPELRVQIRKIAMEKGADLNLLNFEESLSQGHFQRNQDLAIHAFEYITKQTFTNQKLLAKHIWPGRQQWIQDPLYEEKQIRVLIDGAHNPESMLELRQYLKTIQGPKYLVLGLMADKELDLIFHEVVQMNVNVFFTRGDFPRFADPTLLVQKYKMATGKDSKIIDLEELIKAELDMFKAPSTLILSGSLYLMGEYIAGVCNRCENLKWFRQFTPDPNEMSQIKA